LFLSSIFLKEKSYLCGIEMVKRKQYKTVILLVGIFTSLLVFTNVFLNSSSRYNRMVYNVKLGAGLELFYPNWAKSIKIPNSIDKTNLIKTITKAVKRDTK